MSLDLPIKLHDYFLARFTNTKLNTAQNVTIKSICNIHAYILMGSYKKFQDVKSVDDIKDIEVEPDLIIKQESLLDNLDIINQERTLDDDDKKAIESLSLSCSICTKTFKSEKHLIWHQRYHQIDTEPSTCDICSKSFDSRYRLDKHKVIHRFENCTCVICDKTFNSSKSLKLHVSNNHGKDIKCRKCGENCANYTKYLKHLAKPHNQGRLFI